MFVIDLAPRGVLYQCLLSIALLLALRVCVLMSIDYIEYFYCILLQFVSLSFTSFSTERLELVAVETKNT